MIYPAVVAVMAVVVVIVLATFVMPKFVTFFKSFNAKLPLPTRMLLSGSNFVDHLVVGHRSARIVARRRGQPSRFADPTAARAWLDSMILKLPDPRRSGPHGDHRADLPDPLVHDPGRCRPARRHAGHRRIRQQRRLPATG